MDLDCLCRLKNGEIYILNRGRVVTHHKDKTTDKFAFINEFHTDYYVCPLDEILSEIEEAFNLRFLVLSDAYGTME